MPRPPNEVYRLMTSRKYGIPQYTPEPSENLPLAYQHIGVSIGDVGVWTDDSFDPIFNMCQPSNSAINSHGVPANFNNFDLHTRDISKRQYHSPGTIITSGKLTSMALNAEASSTVTPFCPMTVGGSITYEVQSKECAILVLPEGASRERLLAVRAFRAYVEKHGPQWYTFAQDRVPPQGSLFVVTGCDKATSWAIATVSMASGCISTSLKLAVVGMAEGSLRLSNYPAPRTSAFSFKAFSYQRKRLEWPF
ncbi:hypothetical protein C8J57DRAFT_1416639 [Mycena rebaudengoi]|nr:hypothetical protein C8J57DRAFT_1416639 [Mycena rebaudengoi]